MIVLNEGLPGAGKSYDAVATHIVPAIKAGRTVFARLNGLNIERIAEYVGQSPASVATMLHLVEAEDVHKLADRVTQDALVVIDECHEFYVASREPLPAEQEAFFAKHRHLGLDIILISQFYKRVHSAVRARIERKNLYTKLTALGLKNRYSVTFMAAVSPDKFEKVNVERRRYDPAIFALYQSVVAGTENMDVYDGGGKKVWEGKLGYLTVLMVIAVIAGVWWLIGFFTGDAKFGKEKVSPAQVERSAAATRTGALATADKAPILPAKPKREAPIQYILDLLYQARPRVGGSAINADGKTFGIVEFVDDGGRVLDRLSFASLRELGWVVEIRGYGVDVTSGEDRWVATAWPRDFGGQYTDRDVQRIQATVTPLPSVSEPAAQPSALSTLTTADYQPAGPHGSSAAAHEAKWGQFRRPAR